MSKLDEFFKEKLNDHSIAPPGGSWKRVEAGLSKKNKAFVWLRWAAVFLIGVMLLGTLWLQREDPSPMATDKQPLKRNVEKENQQTPQPTIAETKTETKDSLREKKKNITTIKANLPVTKEAVKEDEVMEQKVAQVMEVQTQATEMDQIVHETKGIILTYTLDPIIAPAKESPEPALAVVVAVTEKKGKGFKRMVDFAKNVKNSESPLGELRIKKGELFALDLKKKPTSKK